MSNQHRGPNDLEAIVREAAKGRTADLLALLEVSRLLVASSELGPLLETIAQSAIRILDCERASVFLHDRETNELYLRTAIDLEDVRFPANVGIAGAVFQDGQIINIPDAYADARFNREIDKKSGYVTQSILCAPLPGSDGRLVGVIQVLNKRSGMFDAWDELVVKTFSAQAGVAVQRQLWIESETRRQRIDRDLQLARLIQQGILPKSSPKIENYDIAGWNQPADETGGDFFDFHELDTGEWGVTLADVSGHGIPAALIVSECRAYLRASLKNCSEPDELLDRVNELLSADMPDDRFVTLFFGRLDPLEHRIRFVSAGHGPILFYSRENDTIAEYDSHGCPMGIAPERLYEPGETLSLAHGDLLIVLTDGFHEWSDMRGESFGVARLSESIRAHRDRSARGLIDGIYEDVRRFAGESPQLDDLTVVVVKRV